MLVPGGEYDRIPMQVGATGTGNGTPAFCTNLTGGAKTALTVQITGLNGDTITFEATIDGTNWVAVQATNLTTGSIATTATANGLYRLTVLGLNQVRARVSTYGAGTIMVTGNASA